MTQEQFNKKVAETFDAFDSALSAADIRRGYDRLTGRSLPSQNDVISKFRNLFASLSARAAMFGLQSDKLNEATKIIPEETAEPGILS